MGLVRHGELAALRPDRLAIAPDSNVLRFRDRDASRRPQSAEAKRKPFTTSRNLKAARGVQPKRVSPYRTGPTPSAGAGVAVKAAAGACGTACLAEAK